MHRIARRLLFAAVVSSLGLAALETGAQLAVRTWPEVARVTPLDPGGQLYAELEFHPSLLWRLVPGDRNEGGVAVRVNDQRMRGPAAPIGRRVLFVGDSSVFGWGVPEEHAFAWAAVAATDRATANRGTAGVVTVNAATPGYSSSQARLQLDRLVPELRPDVVVVATLWSDMMQTAWTDRDLFARFGSPEQAEELSGHDRRMNSALYATLRAFLLSRRPVPAERRVLWGSIFEGDPRGGRLRVPPDDHRANLTHIHRTAAAHGAVVVDLILPTHTGTDQRPPDSQIRQYHNSFSEVANSFGATLVNTNDGMSEINKNDVSELFLDPVHPSAKGHARIAEALTPALVEALGR